MHQQRQTGGRPSQTPSERPCAGPWRWMALPASCQSPSAMSRRHSCLLDRRPVRNPPADAHSLLLKINQNRSDPVINLHAAAGILCVKRKSE